MPKYRKKPVVVEAVVLTKRTVIQTLEGDMVGLPGDYLITGVNGEQYPCKPDIFAKTYEAVNSEERTPAEQLERTRKLYGRDES